MPKIPQIKGRTRLSPSSPVSFQSTGAARRTGETISKLGEIGGQAVTQLAQIQNRIDADSRRVALHEKDAQIGTAAQEAFFEAGRESKSSGSDLLVLFDEKLDSKIRDSGLLDDIEDQGIEKQVQTAINVHRNSRRERLFPIQIKMSGNAIVNRLEKIVGIAEANLQDDPGEHGFQRERLFDLIRQSTTLTSQQKSSAKDLIRNNLAVARVEGLASNGRFQDARDAVVKEFATIFKGKDRQAQIDKINRRELQLIDRDLKSDTRTRLEDERDLTEKQNSTFEAALKLVQNATNRENEVKARDFINQAVTRGDIRSPQFNFAKREITERQSLRSGINKSTFINRLATTDNLELLRSRVSRAIVRGELTPTDGISVLNAIRTRKNITRADPVFKRKLKRSDELLDAQYGKDMFGDLLGAGDRIRKSNAKIARDKLVSDQKIDPIEAAQVVVLRDKGSLAVTPFIPNIPLGFQNSVEGLEKAKLMLLNRLRDGKFATDPKVNKTIFNNHSRIYKERVRAVSREQYDKELKKKASNLLNPEED